MPDVGRTPTFTATREQLEALRAGRFVAIAQFVPVESDADGYDLGTSVAEKVRTERAEAADLRHKARMSDDDAFRAWAHRRAADCERRAVVIARRVTDTGRHRRASKPRSTRLKGSRRRPGSSSASSGSDPGGSGDSDSALPDDRGGWCQ